ncbi:MAG: HYC_CC_PP family protein [Lutibacter sp.]
MKEVFKKIAAVLMALVVVLSTMSFTVSQHYCGGELVDSAVFSKAESCEMDQTVSIQKECSIQKKNCCDDVIKRIKGKKIVKNNEVSFFNQNLIFATTFNVTYNNLFKGISRQIIPFKNYSPPLLVCDIQVTHQVFLI